MKAGMQRCSVVAPARLHLGFLNLQGSVGRRGFGSLGLTLGTMATRLEAERAPRGCIQVTGTEVARARSLVQRLQRQLELPGGVVLHLREAIPRHSGLGSGTQLALAVGTALLRLYGRPGNPRQLAAWLGRGRRSGIGVAAFASGGFLLDGGTTGQGVPPLIARLPFPADWTLLLVLDEQQQGLHGRAERDFFSRPGQRHPPLHTARLSQLCLSVLLPALAEQDIVDFGAALNRLQRAMSRCFADAQGGAYTSARVGSALRSLARSHGALSHGQSSWGPTGFALFPSRTLARRAAEAAMDRYGKSLRFVLAGGRNRGATVRALHRSVA